MHVYVWEHIISLYYRTAVYANYIGLSVMTDAN